MDLPELSVTAAARAIREGELAAENYVAVLLERCEQARPLNALVSLDPEYVRAAARVADRQRQSEGALGPLHGVPLVVKDNIDTADFPTTGGTPALRPNRPSKNAVVLEKVLQAGAILLGKTNLHELAYGITNNNAAFGPARNPYDPSRIPGGSSGGTAVAVSARLAPGGLGSDTGGSVRIPAALCGLVGFRPTTLRWSQVGVVPISHTRDTVGPITRSVGDCILLDGVVTGGPLEITPASLRGLRLGVPRAHFWSDLDSETAALLEAGLTHLRDAGAVLIEADVTDVGALDQAAGFPIALYETVVDLGAYLADHGLRLDYGQLVAQVESPDVKSILASLEGTGAISLAAYHQALRTDRPALQETYRRYFSEHDVAAVIFPTTPLPAAPIGEDAATTLNGRQVPTFATFIRNTSPGSVAGLPGLSLPAGITAAGLPVGIEIDGPPSTDHTVLAIALGIEEIMPKLPPPPARAII